jgi:hypothetical protein
MRSAAASRAKRFAFFRIALGVLVAFDLIGIVGWERELFGRDILPGTLLPRRLLFDPTFLASLPEAWLHWILIMGICLAFAFAAGIRRRPVATALFAVLWLLQQRNPFAATPDAPFLRWFLLATLFIPEGEPWAVLPAAGETFELPRSLERSAWILVAAGYCFAGFWKVLGGDPSWISGEAVRWLFLDSSPRRLWYGDWFAHVPFFVSAALTYFALGVQFIGPLCVPFRLARSAWWIAIFTLEASSALFLDVAPIVAGMITVQLFLWNPLFESHSRQH